MFEKMPSILNDLELRTLHVKPEEYSYPFENLVFEGGGNKGLAYCGAIRVSNIYFCNACSRTYRKSRG